MPKSSQITLPRGTKVPDHIAVVLDGNGRWARSRNLPVTQGHEAGAKALSEVVAASRLLGVHTLTLWGFSTENWKRPPKEVAKIMNLIKRYIKKELKNADKEGVRFYHIGRKDRLPSDLLKWVLKAEKDTKNNQKHILNLALDYGGREEILQAVRKIVKDRVPESSITEDLFAKYLYTAGQPYPYPDLFIRTSGEQRTSGLLPWQTTYTEFYFEPDHLPDFTTDKLKTAILDFSRRRRRYGAKDKLSHLKFKPEVTARLELAWWRLQNIPKGTKFSKYAMQHVREQFGMSKELSTKAAKYFVEAMLEGEKSKWQKAKTNMGKFYKLLKEEVSLAFEPSIAASLQVKLWREMGEVDSVERAVEIEDTAKLLYAEVYRLSLFQAAKVAHLRVLAQMEKNMAERGMGEYHWDRAEDYLEKFYAALKDRVA